MAKKLNLTIDQGTTFSTSVTLTDEDDLPIDLSTYSGAAQFRKHYTSTNAVSFTVSLSNTGIVTLRLNANQTSNVVAGRYVYDVEVTDDTGEVSRIIEGIVTVNPNVTR
jgi:hypothetical protein